MTSFENESAHQPPKTAERWSNTPDGLELPIEAFHLGVTTNENGGYNRKKNFETLPIPVAGFTIEVFQSSFGHIETSAYPDDGHRIAILVIDPESDEYEWKQPGPDHTSVKIGNSYSLQRGINTDHDMLYIDDLHMENPDRDEPTEESHVHDAVLRVTDPSNQLHYFKVTTDFKGSTDDWDIIGNVREVSPDFDATLLSPIEQKRAELLAMLPPSLSDRHRAIYEYLEPQAEYARTDDARAFISAVDAAGLELSNETVKELRTDGDLRYGNAYAWISRGIAALIGKDEDVHSEITLFKQEEPVWSDETNDYLPSSKVDPSELAPTGHIGADLLIYLITQAAEAKKRGDTASDIPVSESLDSFRSDNCKDVEVYFAQAAAHYGVETSLHTVSIQDKLFWHKTHGANTYLNLEEAKYKGVTLPPGCVFRRNKDGGYQFLRVTGLAFEQHDAENLFGSAITSWKKMKDGDIEISRLFRKFKEDRDYYRLEKDLNK